MASSPVAYEFAALEFHAQDASDEATGASCWYPEVLGHHEALTHRIWAEMGGRIPLMILRDFEGVVEPDFSDSRAVALTESVEQ